MRQERRITVSSIIRDQRNTAQEYGKKAEIKVPWIRIQGRWLEQAGFGIRARVRIRVMEGCLVLTIDVVNAI